MDTLSEEQNIIDELKNICNGKNNPNKKFIYKTPKNNNSNYELEKIYSLKLNYIGKIEPKNDNMEPGFMWFNTKNDSLYIYNGKSFLGPFPVLCNSIIKQYKKV